MKAEYNPNYYFIDPSKYTGSEIDMSTRESIEIYHSKMV